MDNVCENNVCENDVIAAAAETHRKLASIQIVENVEKHSNADSLEIATILGWQVVVRTNEVQVGDKIIYCEIDSLLRVMPIGFQKP